jgi:membrane protease YdiL (CAAX protease family)
MTGISLALVMILAPACPAERVPGPLAGLAGVAAGIVLYVVSARRRPRLSRGRTGTTLAARQTVLGLWAINEELIWRRVLLGELLVAGPAVALCISSVGFALVHRARVRHLASGAVFGGLYLATGALIASIAAHWVYNALVSEALAPRALRSGSVP